MSILMQRHVQVDGKVRTDKTFPVGFMGKFGQAEEKERRCADTPSWGAPPWRCARAPPPPRLRGGSQWPWIAGVWEGVAGWGRGGRGEAP